MTMVLFGSLAVVVISNRELLAELNPSR
jgi:hypothetical protein